jgi:hypothetical protein
MREKQEGNVFLRTLRTWGIFNQSEKKKHEM